MAVPKLALEWFKIMTALLKCRLALTREFPFEANLFQTLYLILSEIALCFLSLLCLIVRASHLIVPHQLPNEGFAEFLVGNITMPKFALECFKIMTALIKCRHVLTREFPFEANLFHLSDHE